jgi:Ca-activated chloride channel family protein
MRLRLLISLSCLLLWAGQKAGAQLAPADDFFHSGARFYISNSIPQAKDVVEQGLKLYPDDEKLKKLEALLNQQQQQQQQQDQQQQQQNQSQSQQQKQQDQQKSEQQKQQDQQKQDEQKKAQADQKKDDQQKQQDQQQQQADKQKEQDDKDKAAEAQPAKPGEMTPEEAKRLLDAQKGNEQLLQWKPPEKPRDVSRPVKDW